MGRRGRREGRGRMMRREGRVGRGREKKRERERERKREGGERGRERERQKWQKWREKLSGIATALASFCDLTTVCLLLTT